MDETVAESRPPQSWLMTLVGPIGLLGILIFTFVIFRPSIAYGPLEYLDDERITHHPAIFGGMSVENLWKALTDMRGDWVPLTRFTWMNDAEGFRSIVQAEGAKAFRIFRGTNLALHAVNIILVWWLAGRLLNRTGGSLFVAGLFAVHPLVVEPVVWIAQRDVLLSTFFGLLALHTYIRFAFRGGWLWLTFTAFFYLLSLLSGSSFALLPALLMLLDYWPLGRLRMAAIEIASTAEGVPPGKGEGIRFGQSVLEKLPLWILLAIVSVPGLYDNQPTLEEFVPEVSPVSRVAVMLGSISTLLSKMLVPTRLAFFYPHPGDAASLSEAAIALAFVIVVTVATWKMRDEMPFLFVGWSWFLLTLLPQLGRGGVDPPALADRWAYTPIIGIGILFGGGLVDFFTTQVWTRRALATVGAVIVLGYGLIAANYVVTWTNGATVFTYALATTKNNYLAHRQLAIILVRNDKMEEGIASLRKAIEARPMDPRSRTYLGELLAKTGELDEAVAELEEALRLKPQNAAACRTMALIARKRGQEADEEKYWRLATEVDHRFFEGHIALSDIQFRKGQVGEGVESLQRALEAQPNNPSIHRILADVLIRLGKPEAAMQHTRRWAELDPQSAEARVALANFFLLGGAPERALTALRDAVRLAPDVPQHAISLAILQMRLGEPEVAEESLAGLRERFPDKPEVLVAQAAVAKQQKNWDRAIERYQEAEVLAPKNPAYPLMMAGVYLAQGNRAGAIERFRKVLELEPNQPSIQNDLAWILATALEEDLRNGEEAVRLAESSLEKQPGTASTLDTLAAALAEAGRFEEAVEKAKEAAALAEKENRLELAADIRQRQALYEEGRPFRDVPRPREPPVPATLPVAPGSDPAMPGLPGLQGPGSIPGLPGLPSSPGGISPLLPGPLDGLLNEPDRDAGP